MMCVDDQILSGYIDGELSEPWKSQIGEHLEWCEPCRKRLADMQKVHSVVNEAVLEDDAVGLSQNRVMRYLNANVLNKEKYTWKQKFHRFLNRKILLPICSAALTFCLCLIIFTSPEKVNEIAPMESSLSLAIENITPVRLTDNYTTSQSLSNYSLEDIMKYLDESGYDVTVKTKAIIPINGPTEIHMTYTPIRFNASPTDTLGWKFSTNLSFLFSTEGVQ